MYNTYIYCRDKCYGWEWDGMAWDTTGQRGGFVRPQFRIMIIYMQFSGCVCELIDSDSMLMRKR